MLTVLEAIVDDGEIRPAVAVEVRRDRGDGVRPRGEDGGGEEREDSSDLRAPRCRDGRRGTGGVAASGLKSGRRACDTGRATWGFSSSRVRDARWPAASWTSRGYSRSCLFAFTDRERCGDRSPASASREIAAPGVFRPLADSRLAHMPGPDGLTSFESRWRTGSGDPTSLLPRGPRRSEDGRPGRLGADPPDSRGAPTGAKRSSLPWRGSSPEIVRPRRSRPLPWPVASIPRAPMAMATLGVTDLIRLHAHKLQEAWPMSSPGDRIDGNPIRTSKRPGLRLKAAEVHRLRARARGPRGPHGPQFLRGTNYRPGNHGGRPGARRFQRRWQSRRHRRQPDLEHREPVPGQR